MTTPEPTEMPEPAHNYSAVRREATRTTYISSPPTERLTVWHLRQFVEAADAAGVPDNTKVSGSSSPERGLNGVSLRVDEIINGWPDEVTP